MNNQDENNGDVLSPMTTLSHHHHMRIRWKEFFNNENDSLAKDVTLEQKSVIVGHIGMMLLSYGTGAWRVRSSMNKISRALGITCNSDIGLVSLSYTCIDQAGKSFSQSLSLPTTGVNTTKLAKMEQFVNEFKDNGGQWTISKIHNRLDQISKMKAQYSPVQVAFASGLACGGFIFLLGGGIFEVICAFLGAMCGNYVRRKMADHKMTILANIAIAVTVACCVYVIAFFIIRTFYPISLRRLDGYIGAMLFVIPGFPFITAGLDMSKLDMRSGLERLTYAIMIILVATAVGWGVALALNLHPQDFLPLGLSPLIMTILRLIASFCGVFGFSIMFNSQPKMAAVAGIMGAIANTLRLSLTDWTNVPPAVAAFVGALLAGLLASIIRKKVGYPRIALTVPSIVIMVPGLYMYRAMFNLGLTSINEGALWGVRAIMIVLALPLGLITARIIADKDWRHAG